MGASDYIDRMRQALGADFLLSSEIPLPEEITTEAEWMSSVPNGISSRLRRQMMQALLGMVGAAEPYHAKWEKKKGKGRGNSCSS